MLQRFAYIVYNMHMVKVTNKPKLVSIGDVAEQLGISIDTLRRWDKKDKLVSIRVGEKGTRFYRQSDLDFLLEKPHAIANRWVAATKSDEPQDQYYCKTRYIFQARLEKLQSVLKNALPGDTNALLTAVVGEIGNNSYDHNSGNWRDVMGIFFAYSLAERIIILADRGLGILKTLKRVKPDLLNHKEALVVAFTQSISGRYPENRGNGLKFVRQVVTQNDFSLFFQTGDALLRLKKGDDKIEADTINPSVNGCLAVINF